MMKFIKKLVNKVYDEAAHAITAVFAFIGLVVVLIAIMSYYVGTSGCEDYNEGTRVPIGNFEINYYCPVKEISI